MRFLLYNTTLLIVALFIVSCDSTPIYKRADAPIEDRVEDLLSRMTIEEKVLQLNQYTLGRNDNPNDRNAVTQNLPSEIGSLIYMGKDSRTRNAMQRRAIEQSRLGIPILFAYNTVHGFRTIYPIPLAQACSWNSELVEMGARHAARESRLAGIEWSFAPMIDVVRDGRWGRVAESFGEDTYATSEYCRAMVRGFQGNSLSDSLSIAACLKHFVGYGASEGGRDYVATEISRQTLWDTYLPPFRAGVEQGAATIMSSFNDISGTPTTASHYLMTEVVKQMWSHDGLIISDWDAIFQLTNQGVAQGRKEAAQLAFNAGVDVDMTDNCYRDFLAQLVDEKSVSKERLDDAVRRILRLKFRLGLFERPYTEELCDEEIFLTPEALEVGERLAAESFVLLKNESILPLKKGSKIALIGPLAKSREHLLGSWCGRGQAEEVTDIYSAIREELGEERTLYAQGCDFIKDSQEGFDEAVRVAQQADIVILCLGEKREWSGENASFSTLSLPKIQEQLLLTIAKKTIAPIVLILSNGRPLELSRVEPYCDAILEIWQPGTIGGIPVAGVLSGRLEPSGRLSITFPYSTGQIPIYYNRRRQARPDQGFYRDISSAPLYEFGHGLSYSEFEYSEIRVVGSDSLTLEIDVKNIGNRASNHPVLWFVSDPVCSISRPIKELRHFDKHLIQAGESYTYRFEIEPLRDLGTTDSEGKLFVESGEYIISAGDKSISIML